MVEKCKSTKKCWKSKLCFVLIALLLILTNISCTQSKLCLTENKDTIATFDFEADAINGFKIGDQFTSITTSPDEVIDGKNFLVF